MRNEIMEEIRKIRDENAKKHNYDMNKIFQELLDIQENSKKEGTKFVKREPKIYKKPAA